MGYIRTTVDVEIDYDEVEDYEICEMVSDRLDTHQRRIVRGTDKEKAKKLYEEFKQELIDSIDNRVPLNLSNTSLLDEMYQELFEVIRDKFTLDEVTNFVKTKS